MDFELTDDQVALRDGVHSFLEGRFPIEVVRANEETGGRIDRSPLEVNSPRSACSASAATDSG